MVNKKIIKILSIILLSIFTMSILSFAYYTNVNKFFENSRKDDGFSGFAFEREANEFIENGCGTGTILDTLTNLCWLKNLNVSGVKNLTESESYCNSLNFASHSDWRLPSKPEYLSLSDEIGLHGSTCTSLESFNFSNCQNSEYWTSTKYAQAPSLYWIINLNEADDDWYGQSSLIYFTCVRRN